MPNLILLVDVAACAGTLYLLRALFLSLSSAKYPHPLPPGPPRRPVIGNLLDLPKSYEWLHWSKHKELYGPISSVSVFGQHLVIVNDLQIAFDLLEKNSNVYSDRPVLTFGGEMVGWNNTVVLLRYGERLRAYRKNFHMTIGTRAAIAQYHPLIETETRRFLWRVLRSPEKLFNHIRTETGAIVLKISHGYTIEPHRPDPLIDLADEAVAGFSLATLAGYWLVDSLPFLRHLPDWVPGTGFKRTARRWRRGLMELVERPHEFVKQQMARGVASPSYTSQLLENGPLSVEEEFNVKWSAATMYSAGADTTVSAIYSFFLAIVLHPEVQRKAQEELDAVVGSDRLPTFADRDKLSYVDAIVKEALRWESVAPLGFPHVTTEDDIYRGYLIPKGAIVISNIWLMSRDEANYHDPHAFKPERFLGTDGHPPEMDPHELAFGFGRRICPGRELADAGLFIMIAMSLAVFNIAKVRDANGEVIEPVHEKMPGVISHLKEFQCSLAPRSEKAVALINSVEDDHPWEVSDAEVLSNVQWSLE